MRNRTRMSIAIGAVMVVALAMPASATHPTGTAHPTFRTEDAFFTCAGRVQNSATGATSWSTDAPTQSITAQGGCITPDVNMVALGGEAHENPYDAVFSGFFTGNLRDLTVKLHSLSSQARATAALNLRVRLSIDGEPLFTTLSGATAAKSVNVTPTEGANPLIQKMEFSITNLGFAKYIKDSEGNLTDVQTGGLGKEDGDGTMEHHIVLSVDTSATEQGLWIMGATEAPSGITFNPATVAPAKIKSPLPQGA